MNLGSTYRNLSPRSRRIVVASGWVAILVVGGVLFLKPLRSWFQIGGATASAASADRQDAGHSALEYEFSARAMPAMRRALAAYDQIRLLLAHDTVEGLEPHAKTLSSALRAAKGDDHAIDGHLDRAAGGADHLAIAGSLGDARAAFAGLGEHLLPLLAADARLIEGWLLFECSMTEGYNKWAQRSEEAENPYMGQEMLSCGSIADWSVITAPVQQTGHADHEGDEIAYWTCAMHPSVRQDGPGECPICSMTLLPVTREDASSGILRIDEARQRRIGVRTGRATIRPMQLSIRAVGRTTYDEAKVRDVTLKLAGWIEKLYVNQTGQPVRRGQPMLSIYSPELYAAQQEYLLAIRSRHAAQHTGAPDRADYLVRAARERLRLWDLSAAQIDQIERTQKPVEHMPILSPVSGYVVEKNVFEGAAVVPGQMLFRVADLSTIWVEADVYEADLGAVRVGQRAKVTMSYMPGRELEGTISYVYPWLDPSTRTGKVRIELPNPNHELKPEMYANVHLVSDRGMQLMVPESSVIQTGPRQLVFVDLGDGRFEPRPIRAGGRSDGWIEVLEGLREGDRVVTAANFMISSESRIRSAEQSWSGEGGDHAGH